MFEDFAASVFGPDAPNMAKLGKFEYDKFDWTKAFEKGLGTAGNLSSQFNNKFFSGMEESRNRQFEGRNNLAEQLLTSGLSDQQRSEINQDNAELSWLGFGGGSGSQMDSLRGLKFRTDTILGNQLRGANLAGENIAMSKGFLMDPAQVLQGYMANEKEDYGFNRGTEYQRYLANHNITNQNRVIDYTNDQNELGPAFARLSGSVVDWAAQAALSYYSGGMAESTPVDSSAKGMPSGYDDSNYKFGIQPGQSSFGFV